MGLLSSTGLLGVCIGTLFFFFALLGTVAYSITAIVLISRWAIFRGGTEILYDYRLHRQITGEWLLMFWGATRSCSAFSWSCCLS